MTSDESSLRRYGEFHHCPGPEISFHHIYIYIYIYIYAQYFLNVLSDESRLCQPYPQLYIGILRELTVGNFHAELLYYARDHLALEAHILFGVMLDLIEVDTRPCHSGLPATSLGDHRDGRARTDNVIISDRFPRRTSLLYATSNIRKSTLNKDENDDFPLRTRG